MSAMVLKKYRRIYKKQTKYLKICPECDNVATFSNQSAVLRYKPYCPRCFINSGVKIKMKFRTMNKEEFGAFMEDIRNKFLMQTEDKIEKDINEHKY